MGSLVLIVPIQVPGDLVHESVNSVCKRESEWALRARDMENGDNTGYLLKAQGSSFERQLWESMHLLGRAAGDT